MKSSTTLTRIKNNNFFLAALKGKIGQAVVETYLLESGYQIYPFGYENNYSNIARFTRKDYSDTTTTKIRAMPDLLVCDEDNNERYFVQIKTTNVVDESRYWIEKNCFNSYVKYWPEALLVIYCIRTGNIYCSGITDIKILTEDFLFGHSVPGYYLNLTEFSDMTHFFGRIKPYSYNKLRTQITDTLKTCCELSADFY